MQQVQKAKQVVRAFYQALDSATPDQVGKVLESYCAPDARWRGMYPFNEPGSLQGVAETFWMPLKRAFSPIQRREAIFFSGANHIDQGASVWVVSMGHLLGLFDASWLGFWPTRKAVFLRYAEFHRVDGDKIVETASFLDVLDVLAQMGVRPLPTQTGVQIVTPGPRTQDGLLIEPQPESEGVETMRVMNAMLDDLIGGGAKSPPDELARSWNEDMLWFGPTGIGTTYTRERYREQHAGPFEDGLEFHCHHGHIVRVAEGHYSGFFGYPSMSLKMKGGFMGLPASDAEADMRIVDIYRREGDKLAENWIFIDMPYFLDMLGLDILKRAADLQRAPG